MLDGVPYDFGRCVTLCDPFSDPTVCPAGLWCRPTERSTTGQIEGECVVDTSGAQPSGADCSVDLCEDGLACVNDTCRAYCDPQATPSETGACVDGVVCAYLFGSLARRQAGLLSDIDVAVLLDKWGDAFGSAAGIIEERLCRELRTDQVDFVVLNRAPPALAYRVIRDGCLAYVRDAPAREAFEVRTIMSYLDFKPIRETALKLVRRRTLGEL